MRKLIDQTYRSCRFFLGRLRQHNVDAYSAQAAFFLFLSLFPTVLLLLPLLQLFPNWDHDITKEWGEWIPALIRQLLKDVLAELRENTSKTLLSLSAVTAFWSAGRGLYSLMRGFAGIYGMSDKRSYLKLRIKASLYTFLFLFLILAVLALLVFGNQLYQTICHFLGFFPVSPFVFYLLTNLVIFLVLVVFFLLLYYLMTHDRLPLRVLLPGSLLASLGWMLFSGLFSLYIDKFANYANLYGSLTAVVVLMLWLYACMYILFVGAELNRILQSNLLLKGRSDKKNSGL